MSQSSLISPPNHFVGEDARRSTRIERSVPLIVFGQNRLGEPFVERTVSTSLNLHGCRYPSRHDYGVGSWVTLQVVGLNVEPKPPAVRARVRSVHTSQSSRELQQVGVELENPGNVWGIVAPPQDWMNPRATNTAIAQFAPAVAPALDPAPVAVKLDEPPESPEHRMAEVATFPSPSAAASRQQTQTPAEAPKPQRVVITPDGIIAAMEGKLQQAAEKAVQEAVTKHVGDAVREALSSIDDVRNSSIREIEELFPTRVEALRLSSKEESAGEVASQWQDQMEKYRGQAEEMAQRLEKQVADLRRELAGSREFVERMTREMEPQINARLNEVVVRATSEFEGATARTAHRRYELMLENTQAVTQEALMKIEARSAEVQALVQSAVNSALGAFQRQTDQHVNAVLSETQERAVSALASLDAESRAACEARRAALETEVARAAERSTEQFRKGMKAFLYSCLVAAVSAVDEHSKSTLDGLVKDNGKTVFEAEKDPHTQDDQEIVPNTDIDPITH
ncbi:MAG: hypothetical protein AUI12_19130 [Acidobacteria bacterium 13_2_20CM_2_57_6]|nr:MAG: hypothetical protein AUI12_19130 [Acidobacteria bacterium 13_2_20CM_2_57_6]PYT41677.1 MAG: hypothetical protein DMG45_12515 [Acidobacteriota bacterium]